MNLTKYNLKNIISYVQGHIRYRLYYSRFKFLIRPHIREQIEYRINSMDPVCYEKGSCIMCGCTTTALQMANKSCDKPCYPTMMDKKSWNIAKKTLHCKELNMEWKFNNILKTIKK